MKIKKYISKFIISIFLFNSIIPISNASTQDIIERYELLTGDKILISDVINEHKAEIGLSGNTLVNMFNGFSFLTNNDEVYSTYEDNKATLQAQDGFTGNIAQNYLGTPNLLKNMVQNYTYTLYFNCNIEGARFGIVGIDVNGNEVGSQYSTLTKKGDNKFVFTLDRNISSVKEFRFKLFDTTSNNAHTFSDIVLLEGSYDYDSLSYFEGLLSSGELLNNKITVTNKALSDADRFIDSINLVLKEPLRGLSNGNRDKIVEIDGELFIERNTKQIVIDGDTTEFRYNYVSRSPVAYFHLSRSGDDTKKGRDNMEIQCDRFPTSTAEYRSRTYNSLAIHPDTSSGFSGSIEVALLETPDSAGLVKYFKENPTTVVYALRNPVYEPLNMSNTSIRKINLFEGDNYLTSDSMIPVNINITVDRLLNVAQNLVQEAKNNPTFENLSRARYWTNLIDDSIFKDSLQEEINNISNVVDVEIERKSVSANIDVYVKSKNALSMTLSTNSIMFDGYTGTSDMEKINALEVTIHSSLPYDLNAYLEEEIQNSDKSVTIDSNLLQIKESNDTAYKSFVNTTDKIVLKENNPYGNYNKHNIDLKIEGSNAYKADVYRTTIKLEATQK